VWYTHTLSNTYTLIRGLEDRNVEEEKIEQDNPEVNIYDSWASEH